MVDNDRPEQPLGNRTIYFCKTREEETDYILSGDGAGGEDGEEEEIRKYDSFYLKQITEFVRYGNCR